MVNFIKLPLCKKYTTNIMGLGELYEIRSINKLRRRLSKIHSEGILFLLPCNNLSRNDIFCFEKKLRRENMKIVEKGFVDCPPWDSNPRKEPSFILKYKFLIRFLFIIIIFLINFEFLWKKKGHMIYFLTQ